jgi:hypothetical protein
VREEIRREVPGTIVGLTQQEITAAEARGGWWWETKTQVREGALVMKGLPTVHKKKKKVNGGGGGGA